MDRRDNARRARAEAIDVFADDGSVKRTIAFPGAKVLANDVKGGRLAAGSQDSVALVDLSNGQMNRITIRELVQALAFSTDGALLLVGTRSGALIAFDTATAAERFRIAAHPERTAADLKLPGSVAESVPHLPASAIRGVNAIAFDPDGTRFTTAGFGYMRIWDPVSRQMLAQAPIIATVAATQVAQVGLKADYVTRQGQIRTVVADGDELWVFDRTDATQIAHEETFNRSSYFLGRDSTVPIDLAEGRIMVGFSDTLAYLRTLDGSAGDLALRHGTGNATGVAIAPGSARAAIAGDDGIAVVSLTYDGLIAKATPPLGLDGGETDISADGRTILVTNDDRDTSLWHLSGRTFERLPLPVDNTLFIFLPGAFDSDQSSGETTGILIDPARGVALIDVTSGQLIRWVPDYDARDGAYVYLDERQSLYVLGKDTGEIEIRSLGDDAVLHRFTELRDELSRTERFVYSGHRTFFDPSGRFFIVLVIGTDLAYRWDLASGTSERLWRGTRLSDVTYTPDQTLIAMSDRVGNVRVHDAQTLQPVGIEFLSNRSGSGAHLVRFSPDGRLMMITGDGKSQLWDFASHTRIGDVFPSDDSWTGVVPNNVRWLTTGIDGRAVRWDLDVDAWPAIACRAAGRNLTQEEWDNYDPRHALPRHVRAVPVAGKERIAIYVSRRGRRVNVAVRAFSAGGDCSVDWSAAPLRLGLVRRAQWRSAGRARSAKRSASTWPCSATPGAREPKPTRPTTPTRVRRSSLRAGSTRPATSKVTASSPTRKARSGAGSAAVGRFSTRRAPNRTRRINRTSTLARSRRIACFRPTCLALSAWRGPITRPRCRRGRSSAAPADTWARAGQLRERFMSTNTSSFADLAEASQNFRFDFDIRVLD